jgi:YHS domain-containing protein
VRDGKLYLFSQVRAKNAYDLNPPQFIKQGNERFNKPAIGGHCVVSSQKEGKPVKGDEKFKAIYKNYVYHFASAGAIEEFRTNPDKYMPQYENYCAAGMARSKAFPTDGTRLRVYGGKSYLLFAFDADPKGTIEKADENWPKVKAEKDAEKSRGR